MTFKAYLLKRFLSVREVEVAIWVAKAFSNKAIADKMFLSEKTIKFHCTNIYKKLGIESRLELVLLAHTYKEGIVNGEVVHEFKPTRILIPAVEFGD